MTEFDITTREAVPAVNTYLTIFAKAMLWGIGIVAGIFAAMLIMVGAYGMLMAWLRMVAGVLA